MNSHENTQWKCSLCEQLSQSTEVVVSVYFFSLGMYVREKEREELRSFVRLRRSSVRKARFRTLRGEKMHRGASGFTSGASFFLFLYFLPSLLPGTTESYGPTLSKEKGGTIFKPLLTINFTFNISYVLSGSLIIAQTLHLLV